MKTRFRVFVLVAATALLGGAGCQRDATLSEGDLAAIRDVGATYAKRMNARDFAGVAALYAEDAIILPPGLSPVEGREAIRAFLEGDTPLSDFRVQLVEAEGRHDLAYAREKVTFVIHLEGVPPTPGESKVLSIWRKRTDGTWEVLRDIWNPAPSPSVTVAILPGVPILP
jgi:uncharacterized protein (TIGR02246 family)